MADVRTDDVIGEIQIRTEDFQEIKSIEIFPNSFRANDETGDVDFISDAERQRLLGEVADALLAMAAHELATQTRPATRD